MKKQATFQQLIDMCNLIGWDKGIDKLLNIKNQTENKQAYLYGGGAKQQKQASNLSFVIIAQNETIIKLKQYRKDNNL